MKTKLIFILIATLVTALVSGENNAADNSPKQGRFVQLNITGKKYENLSMKLISTTPKAYYIIGESNDNCHWTFNIPDSISQNIWSLQFFSGTNKDKQRISFASVINNDTLISQVNNFENNKDTLIIDGVFLRNDPKQGDVLKVDIKEKSYLLECMKYPGFAFFYDPSNQKKYEDFIEDYRLKIIANPNSAYYISNISAAVGYFRSTAEIIELLDLFSPSLQNSDHGKRIYEYLNLKFENLKLPLVNDENKQEALIQNFTKYNLIELTASWCPKCQDIIPTLKNLHKQYKNSLIITYVTIDDEKGIASFRKDIKRKKIKWRSLWLKNNRNNFIYKKGATGIPCGILVNQEGEIVDYFNFNRPRDLERFHKILQGK